MAYWQQLVVKVAVVLVLVPTATAIIVQTFLYKMMAHMQSRLGPMEAGPHGVIQLVADGAKFFQKELVLPARADRWVFAMAPVVVLLSTFLLFVVVPAGPNLVAEDLDVGVFFALAVSSISVLGILMAGWASANKYALIGGLRAAGQLIAYELPLVLAVVGVVIQAETLSLQGMVRAQAEGAVFGFDGLGQPFILTQFVGFALFLVATQAELTQPPFDMPVAESELVAGYQVEYSGLQFLFFYLAEFASAFVFAALAATMFLGGWYVPGLDLAGGVLSNVVGPVVLFAKTMLVALLIFWIRFTYPRLREDQLQTFAWKYLIPLSLLNILATGVFKVVL
ncbi:MAG: complex I subunit 1/NuoH family protein [Acidimicrobiales bacterium]